MADGNDNGQQGQQGGNGPQGQPGQPGGTPPAGPEGGILGAGGEGGQPGAPPAGGEGGQPGAPPADQPWLWAENIPGQGTAPPWYKADKYKTVDAQARAAIELEKKLGPAAELIGAPEAGYQLPDTAAVEDLKGWQWDPENPLLGAVQTAMKEAGLSQKAHDAIVTAAARALAAQDAADQATLADAIAALGPGAQQRIAHVKQFVVGKFGTEGYQALEQAVGTNVEAYKIVEQLVAGLAGDAQLSGLPGLQGPGFSRADIEAEQYKVFPEGHAMAGRRMYDYDQAHRQKVDRMWKELYPGDNRQEVG